MIHRFSGENGRSRLISALQRQAIVSGDEALAGALADKVELKELTSEEVLIAQDDADDDLYFILTGRLSIMANGREVAIRHSNQHVGEMSLLDCSARRSASVIAVEATVVAKLGEAAFGLIGNDHPKVWRLLAVELCNRLRQRNRLIAFPNPRPVLFIGSSKESLPIARHIQSGLRHDDVIVRVWTDRVFGASRFSIEDLEREVSTSDFALLVISPDDKVLSREEELDAPRDNVVFELGLFMGALSRQRTFLMIPHGHEIKIPTDLLGLTPLVYKTGNTEDMAALIAPLCHDLRQIIAKFGVK